METRYDLRTNFAEFQESDEDYDTVMGKSIYSYIINDLVYRIQVQHQKQNEGNSPGQADAVPWGGRI